ncbi:patatin-like phospholipase family protein [uncultured Nitrosomonas sp.]|uniref:patatin-like phospholipase family protein n=1 Tax=uncultured Nitrosomonas sp. TaxID=156424 RepID=UPI0026099CF0|nr:patatin-like phospholipase family protein [uncultured Nitrosomonas sp.]
MAVQDPRPSRLGLVLTGGGARAAYQVGVLRAIAEMLPLHARSPFPVVCGTSAGAINAAGLAMAATHFSTGIKRLEGVWSHLHTGQIYRSDLVGVLHNALRYFGSIVSSRMAGRPVSLLDNTPLRQLLACHLPFRGIRRSIHAGALHALGITAWGYASGQSVTFYQANPSIIPWKRAQRIGVPSRIGIQHLVASASIPFVFPAIRVNREYFGDGSIRQIAPLSPALHLGADRVLVIGVNEKKEMDCERVKVTGYPPMAQIAGHMMNSIFVDNLDFDLERLRRINQTLSLIPESQVADTPRLRMVESMVITPSEKIEDFAREYANSLPRPIRYFFHAAGAMGPKGSAMLSYVLFEAPFCQALIDLGYRDTLRRQDEVYAFISERQE